MKTKKKCEICSIRFEPVRSDAKYCSNACKQKAHTIRKTAISQKQDHKMVFFMDEYQALCNHYGCDSETLDMILFCFIRKTLSDSASHEDIVNFFDSILGGNNNRLDILKTNAYYNFKEEFLNGELRVIPYKK